MLYTEKEKAQTLKRETIKDIEQKYQNRNFHLHIEQKHKNRNDHLDIEQKYQNRNCYLDI